MGRVKELPNSAGRKNQDIQPGNIHGTTKGIIITSAGSQNVGNDHDPLAIIAIDIYPCDQPNEKLGRAVATSIRPTLKADPVMR